MTTGKSLDENRHAGNPLSQLDKGEVVPITKLKQGGGCNATEVVEVCNDVRSAVQNSCFFGYLDILGFKDIVKQTSFDQLKGIVKDFTVKCAESIDQSRCIGAAKIGSAIHAQIVSDSIYLWTVNDDRLKQFDDLLRIVNAMLATGFQQDIPLRGVVTFGELFIGDVKIPEDIPLDFSFDNGSVYGKALVEAYELESQMDWSGAILTPKAWAKVEDEFERWQEFGENVIMRSGNIKSSADLFNHFPYLLWYDVPFKDGNRRNAIAFNWNYKPCPDLSEEKIRNAFTGRGGVIDDTVRVKLNETIRFFEKTRRVAELCGFGLMKELPVPDSNYVLATLGNV
jgi:hypothetical protein